MPKDIIIIIIIIINIIIIIKAPTDAQGLEAQAEEYQAGIAAKAQPALVWEPPWGHCCPIPVQVESLLPKLSSWGVEALSCPSEPTQSTPLSWKHDPAVPAEDIPLIPDPTRIWAQLALGQAQGTGWKSTLAPPGIQSGCTSTRILQLPWHQLWGPKHARCPAEL